MVKEREKSSVDKVRHGIWRVVIYSIDVEMNTLMLLVLRRRFVVVVVFYFSRLTMDWMCIVEEWTISLAKKDVQMEE